MSETYSKLFHSILRSTIWAEDLETKVLWVTMLALADRHGYVGASIPGLANTAGVSIEATERAIAKFKAPDPYSRSHEFEGRRIEDADRGWILLNYERFRDMRDEEARREYERNRKREQRKRAPVPDTTGQSRDVPARPLVSAHTEEYEQEERKANCVVPPSSTIPLLPASATAAAVAMRTEMEWRVEEVWRAHLGQWSYFFTNLNGKAPSQTPKFTKEIRTLIWAAVKEYDEEWLGPGDRDEWKKNSKARAAGMGIFLDDWCNGTDPQNRVGDGGKRYLEHWRPWRKQAGKGSPVERFADLYFEARERRKR